MGTEFKSERDTLRVLLCGEIDHHTARGLCESIDLKIAALKPHVLLLDFSRVSFMDSSGLAVTVGRKRICDKMNCKIYIVNISGYPEKILRMAGADRLIEFREEKNEI